VKSRNNVEALTVRARAKEIGGRETRAEAKILFVQENLIGPNRVLIPSSPSWQLRL
jgi:hypothetical protein